MDLLQRQAVADAGGNPASLRDRLFQVARIVARTLLCLTLPFGFANRGFTSELLRVVGAWLLISSSQYLFNLILLALRNALGSPTEWGTQPATRMKVYPVVGAVLIVLSELHLGHGGGGLRVHWGQAASALFFIGFWSIMIFIAWWAWSRARGGATMGLQHHRAQVADAERRASYDAYFAARWSLRVGVSTGEFSTRAPQSSFVAGLAVRIGLADASRGVLVAGQMGSGKSEFLRSCAVDACRQPATGLLALSAKTGDATAIVNIARQHRTHGVHLVSSEGTGCNLLAGLTPEKVGSVFKSLTHDPKTPFWSSASSTLITAAAQLAWGLRDSVVTTTTPDGEVKREVAFAYDLTTIYTVIWDSSELRDAAIDAANAAIPALRRTDPARAEALHAAILYFTTSYQNLSDVKTTMGNILAGIEPYIIPLVTNATMRKIWGDPDGIDITQELDRGNVVVLAPSKAENSAVFELVSSFMVAHLGVLALQRTARSTNDDHPIVALLDEYSSYASTDHISLFETSRESRLVIVLSIIALSNLSARLGRDAATSLPSAFGSIVCFATGDQLTRDTMESRLGKVRMTDVSSSSSTSSSSGTKGRSSTNQSTSHRITEVSVIDNEVWRNLGVYNASGYATCVAILSEDGRSLADVLRVPPASAQA